MSRALGLVLWTMTVSLLLAAAPRTVAPRPPRPTGPGSTAPPTKPTGPTMAEAAAAKAAVAAATAAPSFDEVPLFRLGGAAGLPAYLKASATTLADETGLIGAGEIRTAASDFATRDFTFDLVYRSRPGEKWVFHVGMGGADFQVYSRVHGPGHGGAVTFNLTAQPEGMLGSTGDRPGPHLFRLAKRGATLTMALCVDFDGKKFEPTFSKTIPDLAAAAPPLKRHNSPLFAGTGGGTIEAVRLIVDGKPVPTGQSTAPRVAATAPVATTAPSDAAKTGGASPTPTAAAVEDPPLFRLARTAGLPTYLKASGVPLATDTGIVAPEFRTSIPRLLDHDFRFDVVLRFKNDDEKAILMIGLGTPGADGVDAAVLSRVHGPGHGGMCTFTIPGVPEQGLGRLSHSAGPHLFRLEKRGNTLTMAISPDFEGKYDPVAVKTLPDLHSAAPSLTPRTAVAFIKGDTSIVAVRLSVDGKPLGARADVARIDTVRPTPPATASATSRPSATASPLDGTANLIRLDRALPAFFQPQPILKFDAGGGASGGGRGLALVDSGIRTRATDFLTKDFTFDVVYRIAPGTDENLFVGIGSQQMDRDRFPEAAGVHLFAAKHKGMLKLSVGRAYESVFGNAGGEVGPHLVRLRKVGNSLTMEVSPNFQGQYEPAASITVADLKTGAAFLTAKNSSLFVHGKGVVEQVRLVVDGHALGAPDRPAPVASTSTPTPSIPTPTTPTTNTPPTPDKGATPEVARVDVAKIARRQSSIRGLTVSFTETGAMLGGTMDLVLTATPGEARPDTPVTFVTPVGDQMKLVLDDVLRAMRVRYPVWEAEKVELTFDDRVSKKDGASIGAAVGTLLLSMLQGFEIDPKLAMTGDVTADGRVRPIGGVVAKIRAATNAGAAIVALPAGNYDQVADGLVYEGPALLSRIQVIGVGTLDEAAGVARVDRGAKLAAAVTLFAEVQASLKKSLGELHTKAVREKLAMITSLAPNHVSAQLLLLASQDKQPRKLSAGGSLYYMAVAIRGVMPALKQQALAADRQRVPPAAVTEGLRALDRLNPLADPTMQPLVRAYREFIAAVSDVQSGRGSPANLRAKAQAVEDAEAKVNANRDVMEKMLQEGV